MNVGFGPAIPDLKMPQIVADNLKMQNPHYEGFNADGGHYWVKAQTAQQDLKSLSDIRLDGITGETDRREEAEDESRRDARHVRQQEQHSRTVRIRSKSPAMAVSTPS